MPDLPIRDRLLDYLRNHQVATLSVVTEEGAPHAAAVYYAVDEDLRLYLLSGLETVHGRAMARTGVVAGAIHRDQQQPHSIRGIQFRGSCRVLSGDERDAGRAVYSRRFPFVHQFAAAMQSAEFWVIETTWMRLVDNTRGFGHKEEWSADGER